MSELPVDLTEASHDALILFRERALAKLTDKPWSEEEIPTHEAERRVTEPPICRDGRWRSVWDEPPDSPARQPGRPVQIEPTEQPPPPVLDACDSTEFELDEQAFVVRCGDISCRFTSRNKQLFALLARISRRPGHRVLFDDLRAKGDVWDGSSVEDSTIRGAVTRLRKTLRENGLINLAARVTTGTYYGNCYVMLDDRDTPNARGKQMLYAG